ncbi:MAG: hypothetical protein DRG78_12160 [Epsilonproteobacteria bacterium]|nr:MAG: hypothetical protein DRG78_12160 [Campylobacterota bacterium]
MLIDCLECKKNYSDNAEACPECGNPTEINLEVIASVPTGEIVKNKGGVFKQLWAGTLAFFLVVFLLGDSSLFRENYIGIFILGLCYFPLWYIGENNTKKESTISWGIFLLIVAVPSIYFAQ